MRFGCNDFTAASHPSGSESIQVNQTILISDVILLIVTHWRASAIARLLKAEA